MHSGAAQELHCLSCRRLPVHSVAPPLTVQLPLLLSFRRAGVVIRGPNVTLRGVRVMGCVGSEDRRSYALLAYRAPGLLLENCEVQDNGWNGIWAFGKGADVAIVNCKVSGEGRSGE